MDYNMPVMNGIECLTEIGKRPHTRHIPVVFLSGSIEQADRARELGADSLKNRLIYTNCEQNYLQYFMQSQVSLILTEMFHKC